LKSAGVIGINDASSTNKIVFLLVGATENETVPLHHFCFFGKINFL